MEDVLYGVYGASGFGREVMPLARSQLRDRGVASSQIVFIDDRTAISAVNGHAVLPYREFLAMPADRRFVAIAIADGKVRESISNRCESDGVGFFTIQAPNVTIMDDVAIGEGGVLSPYVTLTSNIRIGRHFHANIYSYVAHDCEVGDFVTFAPAVHCNGNVRIEDHAYIGTGAVLKQGRPGEPLVIGTGAIVGMGAIVTHDVMPGTTVVGNPARLLEKK